MQVNLHPARGIAPTQFGLLTLLEFVTICAVLFALSAATGIVGSICLAIMALGPAIKRGLLAVLAFGSASIAAGFPLGASGDDGVFRQAIVILISAALCVWFRIRSSHSCPLRVESHRASDLGQV